MGRLTRLVAVLGSAAVAGGTAHAGELAPYVVAGLAVVALIAAVRWRHVRGRADPVSPGSFTVLLAGSWLVVTILPLHDFASRPSASAVGAFGIQPLVELVAFTAVGVVALMAIRAVEPTLAAARPPAILALLPTWILVSSLWSDAGLYASVRGAQMAVITLLAWATAAVGRADRTSTRAVVELVLRWFPRVTVGLVSLGVAFGPLFVAIAASNRGRFTWIGAHPNGSGLVLSAALLIVVATPPRVLRLPAPAVAGLGAAFVVAMHQNHSRASWIALALGLLLVFHLQGRLHRLLRWVGTPLVAAGAVMAVVFRGEQIGSYLLRDRGSDELAAGNGRRELWEVGLRSLETPFDWLMGHGYGVTRTLFQEQVAWAAGDAHNSVLAILVSTGLVGVSLLVLTVVHTVRSLVVTRAWSWPGTGVAVTGLAVLVVVNAMSTDVLAEPSIGWAVLNLAAALAVVDRVRADLPREREGPARYAGSGRGETTRSGL